MTIRILNSGVNQSFEGYITIYIHIIVLFEFFNFLRLFSRELLRVSASVHSSAIDSIMLMPRIPYGHTNSHISLVYSFFSAF